MEGRVHGAVVVNELKGLLHCELWEVLVTAIIMDLRRWGVMGSVRCEPAKVEWNRVEQEPTLRSKGSFGPSRMHRHPLNLHLLNVLRKTSNVNAIFLCIFSAHSTISDFPRQCIVGQQSSECFHEGRLSVPRGRN